MIATVFAAAVTATTAAHCDVPPPPVTHPESATLEILNGPVVIAGDTLRIRAGLNDQLAPATWTLFFVNSHGRPIRQGDAGYPDSECGGRSGTPIPNNDPSVEFSAVVECVLPTYVESGTWRVSVAFSGGKVGPELTFEVTGGIDDRSGPTVLFTEFPTQPVPAGQSFEVAARVADPNGVAMASGYVDFNTSPGPRPLCTRTSAVPYPSFDIEVRYRCDTTTGSAGTYTARIVVFDLMWWGSEALTNPTVTII